MQAYWYTTANEIEFLEKLGTYCVPSAIRYRSRLELLHLYRYAIDKRVSWEGINRSEIVVYLARALK